MRKTAFLIIFIIWQQSCMAASPVISELFPNPSEKETIFEWIEIFNPNPYWQNMNGWTIEDIQGSFVIENLLIKPYSYSIVTRKRSKLSLNNTEDEIRLIAPEKTIIQTIQYNHAPSDKSYALIEGTWQWLSPTPQKTNKRRSSYKKIIISEIYPAPFMKDGDVRNLETLRSDGLKNHSASNKVQKTSLFKTSTFATLEWIELFNPNSEPVDLSDWTISDLKTTSKIREDTTLNSFSYLVLTQSDINLSFNNDQDTIRLRNPDTIVSDEMTYKNAQKGLSYSRVAIDSTSEKAETPIALSRPADSGNVGEKRNVESSWIWTTPTPNEENIATLKFTGTIQSLKDENSVFTLEDKPERFIFEKETPVASSNIITVMAHQIHPYLWKISAIEELKPSGVEKTERKSLEVVFLFGLLLVCIGGMIVAKRKIAQT